MWFRCTVLNDYEKRREQLILTMKERGLMNVSDKNTAKRNRCFITCRKYFYYFSCRVRNITNWRFE